MTDRELLELAAKAAGLRVSRWRDPPMVAVVKDAAGELVQTNWNPLEYDADAFQLWVKLRLSVSPEYVWEPPYEDGGTLRDPYAATRRAIVRAAAEIGRTS
jgi:hypothetical protein